MRMELVDTCELTGKETRRVITETDAWNQAMEQRRQKLTHAESLKEAFGMMQDAPESNPDLVVYFRGEYIILNHVGEKAIARVLRALHGLFKGDAFTPPPSEPRKKKVENDGKRDSSISVVENG